MPACAERAATGVLGGVTLDLMRRIFERSPPGSACGRCSAEADIPISHNRFSCIASDDSVGQVYYAPLPCSCQGLFWNKILLSFKLTLTVCFLEIYHNEGSRSARMGVGSEVALVVMEGYKSNELATASMSAGFVNFDVWFAALEALALTVGKGANHPKASRRDGVALVR